MVCWVVSTAPFFSRENAYISELSNHFAICYRVVYCHSNTNWRSDPTCISTINCNWDCPSTLNCREKKPQILNDRHVLWKDFPDQFGLAWERNNFAYLEYWSVDWSWEPHHHGFLRDVLHWDISRLYFLRSMAFQEVLFVQRTHLKKWARLSSSWRLLCCAILSWRKDVLLNWQMHYREHSLWLLGSQEIRMDVMQWCMHQIDCNLDTELAKNADYVFNYVFSLSQWRQHQKTQRNVNMKDIKKYNVLPVGKMYYVAVTHDLAYVAVPYI